MVTFRFGKKYILSRPEIKPRQWGGQLLIAGAVIPPVSFLDVSITKQVLILEEHRKGTQLGIHEMEMAFYRNMTIVFYPAFTM